MWRMCSWSTLRKPVRVARRSNSRRRTPLLLRYIICLFSLSRKMDTPENLTQEIFKIFCIIV